MKNQWHALLNGILDRETVREIFLLEEGCPKPEEYGFLTPDQYAKDGICPICDDIGLRVVWTNRGDEPVCCVVCPDCGGLEIPKEQLRQWKINMTLFLEKLAIGFGVNPTLKTVIPKMLCLLGQKDGIEYYFVPYLSHFEPGPTISELLKSPKSVVLTINEMYANLLKTYIKQPCLSLKTVASLNHDGTIVADISEQLKVAFPDASAPPFEFRKKGEYWVIRFEGDDAYLKDSVGLRCIGQLLAKPDDPVFVMELRAILDGQKPDGIAQPVSREDVVDQATLNDLKKRYLELQSDLEDAQRDGNEVVEHEIEQEMEQIVQYLCRVKAKGGETRKVSDDFEKARSATSKAFWRSVNQMRNDLPQLSTHLEKSCVVGMVCNYTPEKKIDWTL